MSVEEACVIIGLPDLCIKESKERIISCLHALNIDLAMKKITIHLSPADKPENLGCQVLVKFGLFWKQERYTESSLVTKALDLAATTSAQ